MSSEKFIQMVKKGNDTVTKVTSGVSGTVNLARTSLTSIGSSLPFPVDTSQIAEAFDKVEGNVSKAMQIEESISKSIQDLSKLQNLKEALKTTLTSALLDNNIVKTLKEAIDKITGLSKDELKAEIDKLQPGTSDAIEEYIDSTLTPLPDTASKKYTGVTGKLHALFTSTVDRLLDSDGEGNFFTGIASMAVGSLSSELNSTFDDMQKLGDNITGSFNNLHSIFNIIKTGKGSVKDVSSLLQSLGRNAKNVKSDVLEIQRLMRTTGFSDFRMRSAKEKLSSILGDLPDFDIEKRRGLNKWESVIDGCQQIKRKMNQMERCTDNVINLKNAFTGMAEEYKPSDTEFSNIYKRIDKLASKTDMFSKFLDKGDDRVRDCYNDIRNDAYSLLHALDNLGRFTGGKKGRFNKYYDKISKADSKIGKFMSKLEDKVLTPVKTVNTCIDTVSYAAKFIGNTANKLSSMFYKPKTVNIEEVERLEKVSEVMEARAGSAIAAASGGLVQAIAVTASFKPTLDSDTVEGLKTIAETAPAAAEALKNADMGMFSEVVKDPTKLTKSGIIASRMAEFAAKYGLDMTLQELADLATVTSFFNAEQEMELLNLSTMTLDRDEGKEQQQKYLDEKVTPLKLKYEELNKKYG